MKRFWSKIKGHALKKLKLYDLNQVYSCDLNQVLKILLKTSVNSNQVRCDSNQANIWVSHTKIKTCGLNHEKPLIRNIKQKF